MPLNDPLLTPKAPYTPEPTRVPQPMPPQQDPPYEPPTAHPEGLAGCKEYGLFEAFKSPTDTDYTAYCSDRAMQEVQETCSGLDTPQTQLACGLEVVSHYRPYHIRVGPTKCLAIDDRRFPNQQDDCLMAMWDDIAKATHDFHAGYVKVHEAGDADPEVAAGIDNLVSCLLERGHADAHKDHILHWQLFDHPDDFHARLDAMSAEEKALKERLVQPTKECAQEQGFFQVQEAAWTAALEKLAQEDPEEMDVVIREGMLVHLQEPGPAVILTGEDF